MNDSDRHLKKVEWSDEDQCFVGTAPELFHGGCHGDNEAEVYAELCEIVDEWLEILKQDGKQLLPPASEALDQNKCR